MTLHHDYKGIGAIAGEMHGLHEHERRAIYEWSHRKPTVSTSGCRLTFKTLFYLSLYRLSFGRKGTGGKSLEALCEAKDTEGMLCSRTREDPFGLRSRKCEAVAGCQPRKMTGEDCYRRFPRLTAPGRAPLFQESGICLCPRTLP